VGNITYPAVYDVDMTIDDLVDDPDFTVRRHANWTLRAG
jgi:hypothetical protein